MAGFALYHPDRLKAWNKVDIGWWDEAEEAYRSGRLVAFCTGTDGTFTFKFVKRKLSPIERKVLAAAQEYRYLVEDGKLYWDNTDCIPSADNRYDDPTDEPVDNAFEDSHGWLKLPNGRYRITINAMDWYSIKKAEREAEGDYTHYLVQVERVNSFREVPAPKTAPWLMQSKKWHAELLEQSQEIE